jgi:carbon-monoxide dehydrogenase small subunit
MEVQFTLNGKKVSTEIAADTVLLNLLRDLGCKSVKCGCETTNCGLCTVWIDGKSRLSCSVLAASIDGHEVTTLEGVEKEAGIRLISCTGRCRTVRILFTGIHYERTCNVP